jgi:hypothetical protein
VAVALILADNDRRWRVSRLLFIFTSQVQKANPLELSDCRIAAKFGYVLLQTHLWNAYYIKKEFSILFKGLPQVGSNLIVFTRTPGRANTLGVGYQQRGYPQTVLLTSSGSKANNCLESNENSRCVDKVSKHDYR